MTLMKLNGIVQINNIGNNIGKFKYLGGLEYNFKNFLKYNFYTLVTMNWNILLVL